MKFVKLKNTVLKVTLDRLIENWRQRKNQEIEATSIEILIWLIQKKNFKRKNRISEIYRIISNEKPNIHETAAPEGCVYVCVWKERDRKKWLKEILD